jgi:hypothetical protein
MADPADDTEADLSKKERLINAWIAAGPDGKTTDVSDLAESSRGYASDIRRGMAGEDEDEALPFEEIGAAHEPELVDQYRSELADDDIDGRWAFADRLEPADSSRTGDDQAPPEPATGRPVPQSRTGPVNTPRQQPPESGRQPPATGTGGQSQQPQQPPQRSPTSDAPPPRSRVPPRASGQGHPPQSQPTAAKQPQQSASGGQTPYPAQQRQSGQQQPTQQRQSGQQQQALAAQTQSATPGFRDGLAQLDRQLLTQQQQATAELNSAPQGSRAYAIAVSKYNLLVDIRESLQQLAVVAPGP